MAIASLTVLLLALGCTVGFLNVQVPPRGIESIQQEDLRRDVWALEQGTVDFDDWLAKRAEQLNLEPSIKGSKTTCYARESKGGNAIMLWTSRDSQYRNASIAALLSLAKSTDAIENPVGIVYCVGRPPKMLSSWKEIELMDLSGAELKQEEGGFRTESQMDYSFIALNFMQLEANVKFLAKEITPYLPSRLPPNLR